MPAPCSRFLLSAGALALAAVLVPSAARAQFVTVEARAGLVGWAGKFADGSDVGQSIGVGLSTRYTPSLSLRLDADAITSVLGGASAPDIYSYMAGLESDLIPSRTRRRRAGLQLSAVLNGGVTQLHYGAGTDVPDGGPRNRFRPAVGAGLRVAANVTRNFALFGGASATGTFVRQGDVAPSGAPNTESGTLVTLPVVVGVRIGF